MSSAECEEACDRSDGCFGYLLYDWGTTCRHINSKHFILHWHYYYTTYNKTCVGDGKQAAC